MDLCSSARHDCPTVANARQQTDSSSQLRWVWIGLMTVALTSCGGSGGGENIKGINVPVDPGSAARSSLLGVDVNGNGVRDEVERSLASYANGSQSEFNAALKVAAGAQDWLKVQVATEAEAQAMVRDEVQRAVCLRANVAAQRGSEIAELVEAQTYDTAERRAARHRVLDAGGVMELTIPGSTSC